MSWVIDPAHTQIGFTVRHMMIANVRGRFEKFSGTVDVDENDPVRSSVEVQIEASSINTNEPKRDAHLRSADFLDADNFPYLYFKSKQIQKIDDTHGKIIGDLTIRGKSKEVTLEAEFLGVVKSPWGSTNAGFTGKTKINRKDWDLVWNVALETGGVLVADEVTINIELELVQQS